MVMKKRIASILILTALSMQAAVAQVTLSNGSQSGTVNAPATPAPKASGSASFGGGVSTGNPPLIQPQMPTTSNMPGAPPAIATPQAGASPGVPVLNSPTNPSAPSPSP